jgi:hypothetical protein
MAVAREGDRESFALPRHGLLREDTVAKMGPAESLLSGPGKRKDASPGFADPGLFIVKISSR